MTDTRRLREALDWADRAVEDEAHLLAATVRSSAVDVDRLARALNEELTSRTWRPWSLEYAVEVINATLDRYEKGARK